MQTWFAYGKPFKGVSLATIACAWILVYEGHEFLHNCHTGGHTDLQDPPKSYAILTAFGNFRGGHVRIKHLGL